jgi:hypothetical protein
MLPQSARCRRRAGLARRSDPARAPERPCYAACSFGEELVDLAADAGDAAQVVGDGLDGFVGAPTEVVPARLLKRLDAIGQLGSPGVLLRQQPTHCVTAWPMPSLKRRRLAPRARGRSIRRREHAERGRLGRMDESVQALDAGGAHIDALEIVGRGGGDGGN